jgi:hypothetical protein
MTLLLHSALERLQARADENFAEARDAALHLCRLKCGWKGPGYVTA